MVPDSDTDAICEQLPPEQLLETSKWRLIRAGIICMHHIETVQQYAAYENQHEQRRWVLRSLADQATEIRTTDQEND